MFKFVIFFVFAIAAVSAQDDEDPEVCQGLEDGELVGVGQELSCSQYWYCEGEVGYLDDCLNLEGGEEFEFNYETNQCDYFDVVNCPYAPNVDPEPEPEPETSTLPPVTQTPDTTQSTTLDPSIPEIECPTNRPGEIVFFPSSNCTEYFICANGYRMKMACMEGFTWNQDEKQCDYPIFSKCSVSFFWIFFKNSRLTFSQL
jgi:Chitin binding Peritrophin-A domain